MDSSLNLLNSSCLTQVGNDRFCPVFRSERFHQVSNLGHFSLIFKYCILWYSLHTKINFEEVSLHSRLLAAWLFVVLHMSSILQHDFRSPSWRRNLLVQFFVSSEAYHLFNAVSWHWVIKDGGVRSGLPELSSLMLCFSKLTKYRMRPGKSSTGSWSVLFSALLNQRLLRCRHQQGLEVWRPYVAHL